MPILCSWYGHGNEASYLFMTLNYLVLQNNEIVHSFIQIDSDRLIYVIFFLTLDLHVGSAGVLNYIVNMSLFMDFS